MRSTNPASSYLKISILTLIVCLGIYARYIDLGSQFTHIDDIGIAVSILDQDELYDINYVRNRISDPTHDAFNGLPYQILRKFDANNWLEPSLPLFKQLFKAIIIPWTWTYAPFQFLLTSSLISHDQSYKEILFWGRFPSFLFGSFGLILIVLVHRALNKEDYFFTAFPSLLLLSLTWGNIFYAKHMSSYSIGVFSAIALLFTLMKVIGKDNPTTKFSIMLGIVLAIISHMQYQVLFFMPAFYLSWLMTSSRITNIRLSSLKPLLITAFTHALLIVPMAALFLLHRTDRGVAWSDLVPFPILFDPSQQVTLPDKLVYFAHFFSSGFYKITEFVFALSPAGYSFVVNIALVIAMAAGLHRLFISPSKTEKAIGQFFLLSIFSIIGLVVLQKLTFGPTRHSLIFLPYMVICVSFGLKTFVELLSRRINIRKVEVVSISAIAAVVIIVFFTHFEPGLKERKNLFVESEFNDLIKNYKPAFVIDQSAGNLRLMEPLKNWPKQYSPGIREFTLFKNPAPQNTSVYMLVGFGPPDLTKIKDHFKFGADFDNVSTADTLYKRVETAGVCVGVCVKARTSEHGIFILVFSKLPQTP